MDPIEVASAALLTVDAVAVEGRCRWRWPMNEATLLVDVSPDGNFLKARVEERSFPDGADLCRVAGRVGGCGEGCGACSIARGAGEGDPEFGVRLARFLDRLCERTVAYEDRFVAAFAT